MWGKKCSGENECWAIARGNEDTEQTKRGLSCSEQKKRGSPIRSRAAKNMATRTTVPTTTQYSHLHEQHRQFQLIPGDGRGGDAGLCFLDKFRGIQRVRVVSLRQLHRLTGTTEVNSSAETGPIPRLLSVVPFGTTEGSICDKLFHWHYTCRWH